MFTGIIQGRYKVSTADYKPGLLTLTLQLTVELVDNLKIGASIAINGCCLTVTSIQAEEVTFDIMQETLDVTTLGALAKGDEVNVERSFRYGDEVGGHILSGHIDTTAKIIQIETPENNHLITFEIQPQWMKYIMSKGYIGLYGASLTVVDAKENTFKVCLIPETLRLTTFQSLKIGSKVNVEIDKQTQTIVNSVERILAKRSE